MLRIFDTIILNFSLFDLVAISHIHLLISVPTKEEVNKSYSEIKFDRYIRSICILTLVRVLFKKLQNWGIGKGGGKESGSIRCGANTAVWQI